MNEITRIQKLISAARSWIGSKAPHDQHQATAALSRARALCAKHGIAESKFHWPDIQLAGSRADFIIMDDPWAASDTNWDIPIKTPEDLVREAAARRAQFNYAQAKAKERSGEDLLKAVQAEQRRRDAMKRFRAALNRQGFAADQTSEALRLFQEAMAAALAAKESRR